MTQTKTPTHRELLSRLQSHRLMMAPHQRERQAGKLLLECIPHIEGLHAILRDRVFSTAGREMFNRQGFSLMVDEDTAIRDVNYRDTPLYETADEAIDAALEEHISYTTLGL